MDQQQVQQLIQALGIVHNPQSSQDQRIAAQQAASYGLLLSQTQNDPAVRHFGLQLLEDNVRKHWYQISPEQQEELKRICLEMLAKGTLPIFSEQLFIKTKITTLIVEIAKREWPQRWPAFLGALFQIAQLGATQAELVLMVLRTLPEELLEFNSDVIDSRRRDILEGMKTALDTLFPFFAQLLSSQMQAYATLLPSIGPQSTQETLQNLEIAKRISLGVVHAVGPFIQLIPLNFVLDNNFVTLLCGMLPYLDVRADACDCLLLLVGQKGKLKDEHRVHLHHIINTVTQLCLTTQFNDLERDYPFQKKLGQLYSVLGIQHLPLLAFEQPSNQEIFTKYLQILVAFGLHPSLLLSSFTLPVWTSILGTKPLMQISFMPQVCGQLLQMCEGKMLKITDPESDNTPAGVYSRIDFDDKVEFQQFFSTFRGKVALIVRLISNAMPAFTFEYSANRFCEALLANHQAEGQFVTVHSPSYTRLEAAGALLEAVLASMPLACFSGGDSEAPSLLPAIEQLLKVVFEYKTQDPLIASRQLHAMHIFPAYYRVRPDVLPYVLGKVMEFASFSSGGLADDIIARRRASSTFVSLANALGPLLLNVLSPLFTAIQEMYTSGRISDGDLYSWMEPLVIISNEMKNYDQQVNFLHVLLQPVFEEWASPAVKQAMSDSVQLLQYVGVYDDPPVPDRVNQRGRLMNMLLKFWCVGRRSNVPSESSDIDAGGFGPYIVSGIAYPARHPFQALLKYILEPLFTLVRSLHGIWQPQIVQSMPLQKRRMLEMSPSEVGQIVGTDDDSEHDGINVDPSDDVPRLRRWVVSCRDTAYRMLGRMAENGDDFFSFPNLDSLLINGALAHIDCMESRHLSMLLRLVISPFMNHCPAAMYTKLIVPVLPHLCNFVTNRLNALWNSKNAGGSLGGFGSPNAKSEIVEDKILRELTRDFAELLLSVTLQTNTSTVLGILKQDASNPPEAQLSELGKHIIANIDVAAPLVLGCIGCLQWPDSISCRKGVTLCTLIVSSVHHDGRFHDALGNDMMQAAVLALAQPHAQTIQAELVDLIRLIYINLPSHGGPRSVLTNVLRLGQDVIVEFDNNMRAAGSDPRRQRKLVRGLLQDVTGMSISTLQRGGTILDVPEKLLVNAKPSTTSWQETESEIGVGQLYRSP